jgi:dihydropteroate synthase
MGIVNMTPDSFSGRNAAGGGDTALALALAMLSSGADMIDIGAESSRPGARMLDWREETERLGDTVARLRRETDKPISIDTYHAETAAAMLDHGADIINDIAALRGGWDDADRQRGDMARVIAGAGAHAVLMHMPAAPAVMQDAPAYADVVAEVGAFLRERAAFAEGHGIPKEKIWLDPGFGFGKTFDHNRLLLLRLRELVDLGYPVLAGLSRKRMIGEALGDAAMDRLEGSLALAVMATMGGANIIRVHDVPETCRAVTVAGRALHGLVL